MTLVSRKGTLAIAAVIDVAMHSGTRPVSAKALAARHRLPPRHLEPVLQALVRDGILKGIRGPHGGYEVARDQAQITAEDILNSAGRIEEVDDPLPESDLVGAVVQPALADHPLRSVQRSAREPFAAAGGVAQGEGVRLRIKANLVCARIRARAVGTRVNPPREARVLHLLDELQQGA